MDSWMVPRYPAGQIEGQWGQIEGHRNKKHKTKGIDPGERGQR